jgi:hypothetical protein
MADGVRPAGSGFRPRVVEYREEPEEFEDVDELGQDDDPQAAINMLSAKAANHSR